MRACVRVRARACVRACVCVCVCVSLLFAVVVFGMACVCGGGGRGGCTRARVLPNRKIKSCCKGFRRFSISLRLVMESFSLPSEEFS